MFSGKKPRLKSNRQTDKQRAKPTMSKDGHATSDNVYPAT